MKPIVPEDQFNKIEVKRKDPINEGFTDNENDDEAIKCDAKSKFDFNFPTDGQPKAQISDCFDFDIPDDKLKSMEKLLNEFKQMDPWMRNEILKEVTRKIKPLKSKLFEPDINDEEFEFTPRRQKSERGLNVKDLAALSSIIHSYAGDENKYSVHDFFFAIERLAKAQKLTIDNMLYIAQNKLKDKVLQFARKAKLLEIDSYHEFKKALVERFEVIIDEKEARYRFFNAQMSNFETVADFEQRIELDAAESISPYWSLQKQRSMREVLEDQKLEVFLEGLRKDLYNIRYKNPKNLSEAVKFAKYEEKLIHGRKRRFGIDADLMPNLPGTGAKDNANPKI